MIWNKRIWVGDTKTKFIFHNNIKVVAARQKSPNFFFFITLIYPRSFMIFAISSSTNWTSEIGEHNLYLHLILGRSRCVPSYPQSGIASNFQVEVHTCLRSRRFSNAGSAWGFAAFAAVRSSAMLETFLTPFVVTTAILDADDVNARADAIISSYESFASLSTKIAA